MVYQTDIERLVAQAQRVQQVGEELIEKAETLENSGVDTTTDAQLSDKQLELQQQLKQAISDFNEAHSRSNNVARSPEYDYKPGSFRFTEDSSTSTVTIEYTGDIELHPSDVNITVTLAGSEIKNVFNGPTSTGETFDIDISGASDGDELLVAWDAKTKGKKDLPEAASAAVDASAMPSNRLVELNPHFEQQYVIGETV